MWYLAPSSDRSNVVEVMCLDLPPSLPAYIDNQLSLLEAETVIGNLTTNFGNREFLMLIKSSDDLSVRILLVLILWLKQKFIMHLLSWV